MAVNKQFYGENGMRVFTGTTLSYYNRYVQGMRCANFNNASSPNETSGRLTTAAAQGITEVGAMPDLSICTHGIAAGGQWNTLWDSGAFDYVGRPGDNMYKPDKGPTMPVSWIFHQLNDISYSQGYCARRTSLENVFWGPDKVSPRDGLSAQMITEMDFKSVLAIPIIQVSRNKPLPEKDSYGRYVLDGSWTQSRWVTLDEYVNGSYTGTDDQTYYWWDQYTTVHGVAYMMVRTKLVENDGQWTIIDPYYDWISNNISAFPLEMGKWSCDASATQPSDGSIKTIGIDFCSPVQAENGINIRYKYDMDADRRSNSHTAYPTSGNLPFILGGTTNNSGFRQLSTSTGYFDGVSFVRGFSHLAIMTVTDNAQFYIWDDRPTNKDDFVEAVHTMMSYLCIPFADDLDLIDTTRPKYIGILDDNNLATGRYEVIENIDDYVQLASDDFINDTDYDPGKYPDVYDYDSEIGVKNIQTGNIFCRAYAVNNEVKGLSQYLWNTITDTVASAEAYPVAQKELSSKFLTTNPVDNIVSLIYYPFNIKDQLGLTTKRAVGLGNQTVTYGIPGSSEPLTMEGYVVNNNMQALLDAGSLPLQPFFNDFRDYEPYTTLELFIPYHGSIALLNSEVLGHMLSVKIAVDLLTGSSTAFIFRDNLIIDQINGNMGVSIPINGLEQATYNANIYNANSSLKIAKANEQLTNISSGFQIAGQAANALASGAMGNIPGAIGSSLSLVGTGLTSNLKSDIAAQQVANAQFNFDHTTKPIKNCGAPTGSNSTVGEQYCRLIIRRPYIVTRPGTDTQADYAENVGFAQYAMVGPSDDQTHLGVFSGHVEMTNVKVNGNMTSKEKEIIKTALMNGVHIK